MKAGKWREKLQQFLDKITYRQLVVLAVVFSLLMGTLVYLGLGREENAEQQAAVQPARTVQVVAATQDIPERTVVTPDMVKLIEVPEDLVPAGAYDTISDVLNHPTSTNVAAGDVMSDKKVYADIRMAGFVGVIPPNCRAVTIGINDITGISGFAKPGDYVDIVLIRSGGQDGRIRSEILMQNVMLLAVNKDATGNATVQPAAPTEAAQGEDSAETDATPAATPAQSVTGPVNMASVTLALPLDDAIRIATAAQAGTLYLMLRPLDPDQPLMGDFTYEMQSGNPSSQPSAAPQPAAPAPPQQKSQPGAATPAAQQSQSLASDILGGRSIEIIRGTQSTRVGVE